MQKVLEIFNWKKQQPKGYQMYLDRQKNIDPRVEPKDLIKDLSNPKRLQKFVQYVNKKSNNGIKILKKLILVHICLIYDHQFCQNFQKINFRNLSDDPWLNKNILQPYFHFLHKICCSEELYSKVKTSQIVEISYQFMFFLIKIIKDLLLSTKNINNLYQYYKIQSGLKYPHVVENFVFIMAYHSQIIYNLLKANLGQILRYNTTYIVTQEKKRIIKFILKDDLPLINQQLKELILNKFFCPFKKGMSVKLFQMEFLSDDSIKFINELFQIKSNKKAIKKSQTLKEIIFDKQGKFNQELLVQLSIRKIHTTKELMKKRLSIQIKEEKENQMDNYLQSCKNLHSNVNL